MLVLYLYSFSPSLSFRMYPIKKVPLEAEALTDWLYKRFEEKEALLAHFYKTGQSQSVSLSLFCFGVVFFYVFTYRSVLLPF